MAELVPITAGVHSRERGYLFGIVINTGCLVFEAFHPQFGDNLFEDADLFVQLLLLLRPIVPWSYLHHLLAH